MQILDEGVDGGVPWHAMELADGLTMRKWASRLPRPDQVNRDVRNALDSRADDDGAVRDLEVGSQRKMPAILVPMSPKNSLLETKLLYFREFGHGSMTIRLGSSMSICQVSFLVRKR